MSFIKNPQSSEQPVCKNLRTKASYVPDLRDEFYMENHHPYSQYHCVKTLRAIGPDDDIVCPEECTAKRSCYVPMLKPQVA